MDNKNEEILNGIIDIPNEQNQDLNLNNKNLDYNFNFETQINPEFELKSQYNLINVNSQTQNLNENTTEVEETEVLDLSTAETLGDGPNLEKIEALNRETEQLINPSLVVNPHNKNLEESEVLEEEYRVDYKEIKNKKKYVFMFIIFAILVLFIIFLPKIVSLIKI